MKPVAGSIVAVCGGAHTVGELHLERGFLLVCISVYNYTVGELHLYNMMNKRFPFRATQIQFLSMAIDYMLLLVPTTSNILIYVD